MEKVIVASIRKSAGKTSVIVGLAKALQKRIGYMKPFGDRSLYRKKRLWDYDGALITDIFGLEEKPEEMSIGFDSSKLRYMYDEESMKNKLLESMSDVGKDKDVVFVEGGKDITYGISVHLDAISLAHHLDGKLFFVISGDDDTIVDDIVFLKTYLHTAAINFGGVIINKVRDLQDFKEVHLSTITDMGITVAGVIPYCDELTHFSVHYLAERLLAKVLTGEGGLNNVVESILIGAMSTSTALRYPPFLKEHKVIIASGDRSDMILASLETNAVGIILTGNILPTQSLISKASERNVPLLLVPSDTCQTARQIDNLEPLLTKDDAEKISLWEELVREHVNLTAI
jgi:BioD-like phosphotransacetylase family protein